MRYQLTFCSLAMLLTACSLTKPMPTPNIAKYSINQAATVPEFSKHSDKVLLVSMMKSTSGYHTSDMIYLSEPYRLQSFAKNTWNAPPSSMLQPLLVESLRNAHLFRVVLSAPSTVHAEYRLDTTLLKLQHEISPDKTQVRLTMDASLIQTVSNVVINTQRFEVVIPAAANPQSGVTATNRASQEILAKIVRFTADSLR